MNKTKVLQFTINKSKGGITQYILNIWNQIDKTRFVFDFVTFSKNKLDYEDYIIESGARVHYITCYPEENEEQFVTEFNRVLECGYDAIEIHTAYWKSLTVEKMARDAGIHNIIIHSHSTGITRKQSNIDVLEQLSLHNHIRSHLKEDIATQFWACSKEAAEWLFGDYISKEKIRIVHNTIDTSVFQFRRYIREKGRESLRLNNRFVIGMVGRLEPVKNIVYGIRVFQQIHSDCPNTYLLIVGDGSLRSELEKQCVYLGIKDDVLFVGLVDNVADFLQVMDLFMLPSHIEGFPISLLEAQCSGLPCIVSMATPIEAILTNMVERIPLERNEWVKKSKSYIEGYERFDQSNVLIENGFDTKCLIKTIEKAYLYKTE